MSKVFMNIYVWSSLLITVLGLGYILISAPKSLRSDKDGVPYFTPQVIQPETGKNVSVNELIKNYRGE